MTNESRRTLLTNAAKVIPLGAVVLASGERVVLAKPRTQSPTALLSSFAPGVGGFAGTLTVTGFQVANGALAALGTLSGNALDATGNVGQAVNQAVSLPAQVTGSCQILNLVLGPLHLDLLGLVVDLNQVVLNITAVPGDGNLLGNLLCAVANLLNGSGGGTGSISDLLNQITNLLNQILAAL